VMCGVWCVVRGVWCVVCGAWCVVRGAWCVVRGAWCVVAIHFLTLKRARYAECIASYITQHFTFFFISGFLHVVLF
jgi:hypothetical protein